MVVEEGQGMTIWPGWESQEKCLRHKAARYQNRHTHHIVPIHNRRLGLASAPHGPESDSPHILDRRCRNYQVGYSRRTYIL